MKLYMYIRLSSADKDLKYKTESESISNQRSLLYQYLKGRQEFLGCEVEEFIDDGYTGTNDNRPAFERMIEHLKNGDCKTVICKDFSRFFRDYVEIGDYLERIFPFLGVRFISVNDNYDSDDYKGTTGGMDVVMRSIVYSFYSRDLSQKIKTVMNAKARKGQFIGSSAPYGYKKDPADKHRLIVDPEAAAVVRRIFDLALAGNGTGEIAEILNDDGVEIPTLYLKRQFPDSNKYGRASKESCWNAVSIRNILKKKEYMGAVVSHTRTWKGIDNPQTILKDESEWIIVPNCHEAIVSEEEYEGAQKAIKKVSHFTKGKPQNYLLRTLVHCGVCGRAMTRNPKGRITVYYCEKSSHNKGTKCPIGERYPESDLEKIVVANFLQVMNLISDYDKRMKKTAVKTKGTEAYVRQSILSIEKSVKQNHLAKVTAYERYSDGEISRAEFSAIKDQLAMELDGFSEKKKALEQQLLDIQNAVDPELKQLTEAADEVLKAGQITNQMLLYFIDEIDVYSGMRVEIKYKFKDVLQAIIEQ